jgi:hypothetical protein
VSSRVSVVSVASVVSVSVILVPVVIKDAVVSYRNHRVSAFWHSSVANVEKTVTVAATATAAVPQTRSLQQHQ